MTDALAQFDALMRSALDAEVARAALDVRKVEAAANSVGQLNGSRRVVETARVLGEAIERFRVTIDEKWKAYMKPHLSTLTDSERYSYINSAIRPLDACAAKMEAELTGRTTLAGMQHIGQQLMRHLQDIADRERRFLAAELNLYAITPMPGSAPAVHVTTHGQNSPVNVGSGTLAQSVRTTTASMAELSKALSDLLAAIDSHHGGAAPELRQVIEDARTEAEKPDPNRLRLKGSLGAAKDVVQTIGGLSTAWDAVERIAKGIGGLF